MVRDDSFWEAMKPDAVILWGEPPTSKVLRQRLADLDIRGYLVGNNKRGINPIHGRIEWAGKSVAAFVERTRGGKGHYGEHWARMDRLVEESLSQAMQVPHDLFEGDIHRLLGRCLPADAPIIYASSLAIRDAEWFMPRRRSPLHPFSLRGANGIDGMLSLSRGIAAGMDCPAWSVMGDLAFLHDSNGLLGCGRDDPGLFVILLNNNGGGIFEFLPVAERAETFEKLFSTPQTVDFRQLVEAHGGTYSLGRTLDDVEAGMQNWDHKGLHVMEIRIDRKTSRRLHREFIKPIEYENGS